MDPILEHLKKHIDWNESYYFNFHDIKNDLTVFMRIGNKVNKKEKSMFFYLMSSNLIAGIKLENPCDDKPWKNAGLEYHQIETGKWKLTYDGPVFDPTPKTRYKIKMNVTWEALNPQMDYIECVNEKEVEMSQTVASKHYEQYGRAYGKIEVDDHTFNIEALGERDYSLGIRDWGSPRMWMWINSAFSSKEAFNITKVTLDEGDIDAGYFHTDSLNHPLVKSDIDIKFNKGIPSQFSMVLYDKKGDAYPVEGEVIRYVGIPLEDSMLLIETLSRYGWKDKIGYGVAEFLIPKIY